MIATDLNENESQSKGFGFWLIRKEERKTEGWRSVPGQQRSLLVLKAEAQAGSQKQTCPTSSDSQVG